MGDNLQKNGQYITGIVNVSDLSGNKGNTKIIGNTIVTSNTIASSQNQNKTQTQTPTQYQNKNQVIHPIKTISNKPLPINFSDFIKQVYEASHIYILVWFIIIYLVVYVAFGSYLKTREYQSTDVIMSRTFDFVIFIPVITYLLYSYFISSQDSKDNILINLWVWSIEFMDNIMNLFGVLLFTLFFYLMVFFLNIPMSPEKQPFSVHFLESKIWTFIATFMILMFFKHILGIDLLVILNNFVSELTNTRISNLKFDSDSTSSNIPLQNGHPSPHPPPPNQNTKHDEVFNIGNNLYTYEDAQNICSVYGARMATYDEIEDSYNHGAEWCNYGWSDGQMAFFPTQKSTWDKLQKNPKLKNACGRPGINGGFIDNPYIRFGVNCYGKKPDPKESDKNRMNQPINIPKTQQEIVMEQKMQFWKDNADKLLQINSFNNSNWSEY